MTSLSAHVVSIMFLLQLAQHVHSSLCCGKEDACTRRCRSPSCPPAKGRLRGKERQAAHADGEYVGCSSQTHRSHHEGKAGSRRNIRQMRGKSHQFPVHDKGIDVGDIEPAHASASPRKHSTVLHSPPSSLLRVPCISPPEPEEETSPTSCRVIVPSKSTKIFTP